MIMTLAVSVALKNALVGLRPVGKRKRHPPEPWVRRGTGSLSNGGTSRSRCAALLDELPVGVRHGLER